MAQQHTPEPEKENSERWLLTYSDLITLLLIFFIILYTISKQDEAKFKQISESLSSALSGSKEVIGDSPGPHIIGQAGFKPQGDKTDKQEELAEKKKMQDIKQKVEELAKKEGLQTSISVTITERGVAIRIVDQVLFNSGYADLTPQADRILRGIGQILLTNKDQYIRIEGHTDNVPISNGRFASNWELSAARATKVLRLFVNIGFDPRLLSETGYGEYRPVADNKTELGKSKNRRVEIVILSTKFNQSESQSLEKPQH